MNDEKEWENAMREIIPTTMPVNIRRFFASILAHNKVKDAGG